MCNYTLLGNGLLRDCGENRLSFVKSFATAGSGNMAKMAGLLCLCGLFFAFWHVEYNFFPGHSTCDGVVREANQINLVFCHCLLVYFVYRLLFSIFGDAEMDRRVSNLINHGSSIRV